jgi:hypothetical protein
MCWILRVQIYDQNKFGKIFNIFLAERSASGNLKTVSCQFTSKMDSACQTGLAGKSGLNAIKLFSFVTDDKA